MSRRGYRKSKARGQGSFDPSDAKRVKHSRLGVWDLYEEIQPALSHIPGYSRLQTYLEAARSWFYVWRMIADISSIPSCWLLLGVYFALQLLLSLIPAVSLWYSAQLLNIVQSAVDKRSIDKKSLFEISAGRLGCLFVTRALRYGTKRCATPLNLRIKQYYSIHVFRAMSRLDVPTFNDDAVQRQLEQAASPSSSTSIAWQAVSTVSHGVTSLLQLTAQLSVLVSVLRDQRDGPLLAILSFTQIIFARLSLTSRFGMSGVWAATTKDPDYIRMEGLKRTVSDASHRKEIVAGGLQKYLFFQFEQSVNAIGDRAGGLFEVMRLYRLDHISLFSFLQDPLRELPQIVFTLRAVKSPASIPISLASLNLVTQTTTSFTQLLVSLYDETETLSEKIADVRRLYEVANIANRVSDGNEPFPDDQESLDIGICVEFRNVTFQYPGTDDYALRNTSFKIEKGQLCVLVGTNGSGKSTILKLITRLYEPSEGVILLNDRDIKLFKLDYLRRAISVLFQDFTLFPLSIKENIGLGDPENATDQEKIYRAAQLGGAKDFVERLPDGFETYLERPVRDYYSSLPEGTTSIFGRPVDYTRVRSAGNIDSSSIKSLSGGQLQRIALSRSFMRSLISQQSVGLLLFDEPSASLDPKAEHDLFVRLRQLRGNKTMIFSSHRFGNLTRYADLILYMNNAVISEEGTHETLIKKDGEYANIWKLQAQAFLS